MALRAPVQHYQGGIQPDTSNRPQEQSYLDYVPKTVLREGKLFYYVPASHTWTRWNAAKNEYVKVAPPPGYEE